MGFETNSRLALRAGFEAVDLAGKGVSDVDAHRVLRKGQRLVLGPISAGLMDKATLRSERFKLAFEGLGLTPDETASRALGEHYIDTSPYQTALFPGAIEVLEALQVRGHQMVVLTNGFEEVQHIKVKNSGLEPSFLRCSRAMRLG